MWIDVVHNNQSFEGGHSDFFHLPSETIKMDGEQRVSPKTGQRGGVASPCR